MSSSGLWNVILLTGIPSLIIGSIVGMFFGRSLNPNEQDNRETIREMELKSQEMEQKSRELEDYLHKSQDDFKTYKGDVENHFRSTAELVVSLTEIYRDIHRHLAQSAQQLCDTGNSGPVLTRLIEAGSPLLTQLSETGETSSDDTPTQPLDYAPKSSPNEKGVLTEDFGLEKKSASTQGGNNTSAGTGKKNKLSPAMAD